MREILKRAFSFILLLLIIIVFFSCCIIILSNGTTFEFDVTEMEVRRSFYDCSISLCRSGIYFEPSSESNDLKLGLSGWYYPEYIGYDLRDFASVTLNKDIQTVFKPSDKEKNYWLCIVKDRMLIYREDGDYQVYDIFFDGMTIYVKNKFSDFDKYYCSFGGEIYREAEQKEINKELSETKFFTFPKLNNFTFSSSYLFKNVILPWFWEIIMTFLGSIFIYTIIFNRTSRIIRKTYTRNLKERLFPEEHSWFGNNTPNEIYVSVKVFIKNKTENYNLLNYIEENLNLSFSKCAIIGNAGEGKTFALSRIALGLLDGYFKVYKKSNYRRILNRDNGGNGRRYVYSRENIISDKKINKIPIILNFSELTDVVYGDQIINYIYDKIFFYSKEEAR